MAGFAAVVCAVVMTAGCGTPKSAKTPPPNPAPVETPAVTNAPPETPMPEQISRPRPPADAADNMASNILAWDALTKVYHARPGETNATFTFSLTNVAPERVMIFDTSTTCDCTVAQLPSKPWTLQPGQTGSLHASLDLRHKTGQAVTNYVIVFTSKGNRLLTVWATLPRGGS